MFAMILNFLGGGALSTIATSLSNAYQAKLNAANDQDRTAADVLIQDLQAQQAMQLAQMSRWWSALPILIAEGIWVSYFFKTVVWDTEWGLGSTPELHGQVGAWLGQAAVLTIGYRAATVIASRFAPR